VIADSIEIETKETPHRHAASGMRHLACKKNACLRTDAACKERMLKKDASASKERMRLTSGGRLKIHELACLLASLTKYMEARATDD